MQKIHGLDVLQHLHIEQRIFALMNRFRKRKLMLDDDCPANQLYARSAKVVCSIPFIPIQQAQLHFLHYGGAYVPLLFCGRCCLVRFLLRKRFEIKHQQIRRFFRQLFHCG